MMSIPHGLWLALQQYLLTQPMGDVEGLMNGLRSCQPVPTQVDEQPAKAGGQE